MTSDLDIYRSAKLVIDIHGDAANIHVAQMLDEMLDRGDMEGRATWKRIGAAVDEMMAEKPAAGVRTH